MRALGGEDVRALSRLGGPDVAARQECPDPGFAGVAEGEIVFAQVRRKG